jgi:hypothetical protein
MCQTIQKLPFIPKETEIVNTLQDTANVSPHSYKQQKKQGQDEAFIKSILPISVITAISVGFVYCASNFHNANCLGSNAYSQRQPFYLSMLSDIPTTGI